MTDSSGTVVWSADYKPFGEATVTISTITNNLRFPGQYYDAETGLIYNYMRDYNSTIGRYIEADPIGLKGGPNVYIYANDNSINWNNVSGLDANTWTYGEIGSWAIKSYKDPSAPAGLADAKASLAAVCSRGNSCNSVDGSTATNPFDKAAWKNIVNASGGTDKSGGANYFNVGTNGLFMTHCFKCSCGKKTSVL